MVERAVAAPGVVPSLDPGEQRQTRVGLGLPTPAVDQLAFEAGEEALGHRVVVGVAYAAHRGTHAHLLAAFAECDARVLTALVAVMDQGLWLALLQRHVQCGEYE